MIESPTLTLRRARTADIPAIARLMVQLYHAELPGSLRGPLAGQHALLGYTLERGNMALFRRYVAVDTADQPVATASFRLERDRLVGALPGGTMRMANRELGMANALRLFGTLLRSSILPETALGARDAFIHSVVVDERLRGRGIGGWLMGEIERLAADEGAQRTLLRVIAGNHGARRLYERLGYHVVGRTPPQLDWLVLASQLMCKTLPPPA